MIQETERPQALAPRNLADSLGIVDLDTRRDLSFDPVGSALMYPGDEAPLDDGNNSCPVNFFC